MSGGDSQGAAAATLRAEVGGSPATGDPRRRQKALAKKAAKRKEKLRAAASVGSAASLGLSRAPLHACLVPAGLFEEGIGNVLVSRRLSDGDLALGGFLLDPWCLGVKNARLGIYSETHYRDLLERLSVHESFEEVEPPHAKKLILDAASYALGLGFPPHPDYRDAARVLTGIDASGCNEVFSFGHEGKPWFVSGPNDTPARCRQIVDTLNRRLGPDGFHFIIGAQDPSVFAGLGLKGVGVEPKWRGVLPPVDFDDEA